MDEQKKRKTEQAEPATFGTQSGGNGFTAKKDWRIFQNDIDVVLKKGDPIPAVISGNEKFLSVLKTEGVI